MTPPTFDFVAECKMRSLLVGKPLLKFRPAVRTAYQGVDKRKSSGLCEEEAGIEGESECRGRQQDEITPSLMIESMNCLC